MKISQIDISKGRLPTEKENIYMSEYFTKASLHQKRLFMVIFIPLSILLSVTIIGQLMSVIQNNIVNMKDIIIILLYLLAFIGSIYMLRKAFIGMPQMKFIKEKEYYVFDVWCEKAIINYQERTDQPAYRCMLRFQDGSMMKDKYFIELREIKNHNRKAKAEEMKNRTMLVCYFPQIKYAKLFDKAMMIDACVNSHMNISTDKEEKI